MIKNRLLLLDKSGFTVLQTVIALGIGFVMISGTTTMLYNLQKQNRILEDKLEIVELRQGLDKLLFDGPSCTCMFSGRSWPSNSNLISISSLPLGYGVTSSISEGNPIFPKSRIRVTKINLINLKDLGTSGGVQTRGADLKVDFTSANEVIKSLIISNQAFRIQAGTSGTDQINSCIGSNTNPDLPASEPPSVAAFLKKYKGKSVTLGFRTKFGGDSFPQVQVSINSNGTSASIKLGGTSLVAHPQNLTATNSKTTFQTYGKTIIGTVSVTPTELSYEMTLPPSYFPYHMPATTHRVSINTDQLNANQLSSYALISVLP